MVFLGPPGSGKGTQAVRLAAAKEMVHLSTGEFLREAVKAGTELGRKIEEHINRGELIPDDLIIDLIENKVAGGEFSGGVILDGFPRTIPQAKSLKKMLAKNEIGLDRAILFAVSDEEIVKRLSGRWYCPQCNAGYNYPVAVPKTEGICDHDGVTLKRRPDDEEAVVRNRLDIYKEQTRPIEDFYRTESILTEIVAEDSPDNIFARLMEAVC
ncbi:MAG: adenylate kinase [candidate division Zixibacteria bacterium]|nr:adenylate kinase [candidate division Zixibacteria bacterium]